MKKSKSNFSAISALIFIANKLEDSSLTILGQYNPLIKDLQNIDSTCMNTRRKSHRSKNLFELDEENELKDLFTHDFQNNVELLSAFLKTTPIETLLFTATFSCQFVNDCDVDYRDLKNFFNVGGLTFTLMNEDMKSLFNKGLLNRRNRDFFVSPEATKCIYANKPFKPVKPNPLDRYIFCQNISELINNRIDDKIRTRELFTAVQKEEEQNKTLSFLKKVAKLLPNIEDRTFFYEICNDFIKHGETGINCTLKDIYDSQRHQFSIAKELQCETHKLQTTNLITCQPARFFSEATIELSSKGKELFLEEDLPLFESKGKSDMRLISVENLPDRKLFFSEKLTKELDFLKENLMEEKFSQLQERLKKRNLPTGINVLMYGYPGTGKTAFAEMLAKETGRSIYHVDIAASKSCWFGESEKKFKRIFVDYSNMCKNEKLKPILLFNEADALFGKRKDVSSSNSTQTENALQNILLEEMEKLDGILIATTNLADNLDKAFDRRFLFKIQFEKPDTTAKKAIWKSKIDWISDEESLHLANKFDLTGGEIDNIIRKCEMEILLHGTQPTFAMLEDWCRQEKIGKGDNKSIGFSC